MPQMLTLNTFNQSILTSMKIDNCPQKSRVLFSICLYAILTFASCHKPALYDAISGSWAIQKGTFFFHEIDAFECLHSNALVFSNDGALHFSGYDKTCYELPKCEYVIMPWRIDDRGPGRVYLSLPESQACFPASIHLKFIPDYKAKWFDAELSANGFKLRMRKLVFFFDRDLGLVKECEAYTR